MSVSEVHVYVPYFHLGPGNFGAETECHPLVGLNADYQRVSFQKPSLCRQERVVGEPLEHDRDFCDPLRHPFAGPNVERNPGPSARVNIQAHRSVGFCGGGGIEAALVQIPDYFFAALPARRVLAPRSVLFEGTWEPERRQNLDFLDR